MTIEEAKYFSILLGSLEYDEYSFYIKNVLDGDVEIDDLLSDLLFAGDDYNKCCDVLSSFYKTKPVDDIWVSFKLLDYARKKYELGEWDRIQTIKKLVQFSREGNKFHEDKIEEPWATMKLLGMLLDDNNSIIYESDLDDFLSTGKLLTENIEVQEKLNKLFNI